MKQKEGIRPITIILVAIFVVGGLLIVALDWKNASRVVTRANWLLLPLPLLLTGASYLCLICGFALVFRTFGIRLPFKELAQIGFVSSALTYLVNVGGVTGLPLQLLLLRRRGRRTEDILAASVFQLLLSGFMLLVLIPIGLFNVENGRGLTSGNLAFGIAAGTLTLLLVLAAVVLLVPPVRARVLRTFSHAARSITRRDFSNAVNDFDASMTSGLRLVSKRPGVFALVLMLAAGDWTATVTALWLCFHALGQRVGLGVLLTGFSLGVTAGFVSLIPGGLGVQEGSMSGIYAFFGVPLTSAVLGAVLFRVVYYFVPFLVSLGFYRRLLRGTSGPS